MQLAVYEPTEYSLTTPCLHTEPLLQVTAFCFLRSLHANPIILSAQNHIQSVIKTGEGDTLLYNASNIKITEHRKIQFSLELLINACSVHNCVYSSFRLFYEQIQNRLKAFPRLPLCGLSFYRSQLVLYCQRQ